MIDIGTVCKCHRGIVGLVTNIRDYNTHDLYSGVCIDGERTGKYWESKHPEYVADNPRSYFNAS